MADIERITAIWRECLGTHRGPYLFGAQRTMADAMYAPVTTRFLTYDVRLDAPCAAYCQTIVQMPEMVEWIEAAQREPIGIDELEVEF
jgi:glutathione S-transferase